MKKKNKPSCFYPYESHRTTKKPKSDLWSCFLFSFFLCFGIILGALTLRAGDSFYYLDFLSALENIFSEEGNFSWELGIDAFKN